MPGDVILCGLFFFFNDTATTEIYTLSLHDALPIWASVRPWAIRVTSSRSRALSLPRSEEHTSELQSRSELACRLLLEKKKKNILKNIIHKNKKKINKTEIQHTKI